jgi:hypothetical protein
MVASESFSHIPGVRIDWIKKTETLPPNVPSFARSSEANWISSCPVLEEGSLLNQWFSSALPIEVEEGLIGLGNDGRLLTVLFVDWDPESTRGSG